jgi:methylenetetrahydrofolate dehydrogenase (NADP+)/methenyltetrahydrofolate cyclohydrolase
MSIKIDGRKLRDKILENLKSEISSKKLNLSLGILLIGNDKASETFVNVKRKFGEEIGVKVNVCKLNYENLTAQNFEKIKNEIIEKLKEIQKQNDGVIVQLPLPEKLKIYTNEILSHIQKEKDVDNLNNGNFKTPIVKSLEKILKFIFENSDAKSFGEYFRNKKFAIVGQGQVVGMPIKRYLDENGFQNIVVLEEDFVQNENVIESKFECKKLNDCDVVISCVGSPYLIKAQMLQVNSILIDYGCSYVSENENMPEKKKLVGDFDVECFSKSSFYTPTPGGTGPMVVACLFENLLSIIN